MVSYLGTMSAEIEDAIGIVGTAPAFVQIPEASTLTQIAADVFEYAAAAQALTAGSLKRVNVRLNFEVADPPAATGDIEKGALLNFNNAFDAYAQGQFIPDVAPAVLNAQGLLDLTNADVTGFIAFMTTAHTAITVITKGVRALTSLKDALISFRKHRKPLSRKTKEV